jgi:hypothetical protein
MVDLHVPRLRYHRDCRASQAFADCGHSLSIDLVRLLNAPETLRNHFERRCRLMAWQLERRLRKIELELEDIQSRAQKKKSNEPPWWWSYMSPAEIEADKRRRGR